MSTEGEPPCEVMTRDRGLASYLMILGPAFVEALESKRARGHWIDCGAGDANAQRDWLRLHADWAERLTAIDDREATPPPPGLRIVAEKSVEELGLADVGQADVITDV